MRESKRRETGSVAGCIQDSVAEKSGTMGTQLSTSRAGPWKTSRRGREMGHFRADRPPTAFALGLSEFVSRCPGIYLFICSGSQAFIAMRYDISGPGSRAFKNDRDLSLLILRYIRPAFWLTRDAVLTGEGTIRVKEGPEEFFIINHLHFFRSNGAVFL